MKLIHTTNRLDLKILRPDQAAMVLDFYIRNQTFLEPFEPQRSDNFFTLDYHRSNLAFEYNSYIKFSYLRYWIFLKGYPELALGSVCFSNFRRGAFQSCILGYKLDQYACHNGFMYEALSYLIPLVCREYSLHRIEALVQPDNFSSIRLLEKLNFEEEGYLKSYANINGSWKDHLLFTYIDLECGGMPN